MYRYFWLGIGGDGHWRRGVVQATGRRGAREQLQHQSIARPLLLPLSSPSPRIGPVEVTLLIRQLATLLQSGVPLARALEGMVASQPGTPTARLCDEILRQLHQGDPLSTILAQRPALFDRFLIHLVHSGEHSSQLPRLLQQAADHRERSQAIRRQGWRAVTYPLGVLLFSITLSLFLLLQVVPQFETLFHTLDGELPALTQTTLALAHSLQQHWLTLLGGVGVGGALLLGGYHTLPTLRLTIDRLLLRLPLIGTTLRELLVARVGRTLATLHRATIPLHTAVQSAREMTALVPFQHGLEQVHHAIAQGVPLSRALEQSRLFPPIAIQMVHAGEESGELAEMMERLADYYEVESNHRIERMTGMLEPLLITLIGGVVGLLAIALYLPIFQMGQQL